MSSRLHKFANVYERMKYLIDRGAVKPHDRPLWFDVYESFPPLERPVYHKPVDDKPIREIFYEEDKARATVHKALLRYLGPYNLEANGYHNKSRQWVADYRAFRSEGLTERAALAKLHKPSEIVNSTGVVDEILKKAAGMKKEEPKELEESS